MINITYVKAPIKNTLTSIALFFFGNRTRNRSGIGILRMIKSEEMLNTAFVIRWFVAAEHCSDVCQNNAQKLTRRAYWSLVVLPSTTDVSMRLFKLVRAKYIYLIERSTPNSKVQNLHNNLHTVSVPIFRESCMKPTKVTAT